MIVGSMVIIYFVRMLLLFLFSKALGVESTRKATNLALVMSVIFCTMLRYIVDEFSSSYFIGGFIIYLLGLMPDKKVQVKDAN